METNLFLLLHCIFGLAVSSCPHLRTYWSIAGSNFTTDNPINLCLSSSDVYGNITATMWVCNQDLKSVNYSYYSDTNCTELTETKPVDLNMTGTYSILDCGGSQNAKPCNYVKHREYEMENCGQNGTYVESGYTLSTCDDTYLIDVCDSNDEYIEYDYRDEPGCTGNPTDIYHFKTGCNELQGKLQFENVTYALRDGIPCQLNVYWPETMPSQYVSTMVYIHGGGWENGSYHYVPEFVSNVSQSHNYILVSVGYRLTTQAGQFNNAYVTFPAQIEDVLDAITFLKQPLNYEKFRIDISNMGCWGDSAGAHLCVLLGTYGSLSPWTNLTWSIGYYTPTQIIDMEVDCGNTGYGCGLSHDFPGAPESKLIGWSHGIRDLRLNQNNTNMPYPYYIDLVTKANPINYANTSNVNKLPAFFIAHGIQDTTVPYLQSIRFINKLESIKHPNYVWEPCNCTVDKGCQHAHQPNECWEPVDQKLNKWLDQFDA